MRGEPFYQQKIETVLAHFGTDADTGLDEKGAAELLRIHGPNTIVEQEKEAWWRILAQQFSGILIYILIAAALISGLFGEWVDTGAILVILIVNGIIGYWQERKAQDSIEALKKLASNKATVVRGGKTVQVDASALVPGDLLLLETGDRIPADARIVEAHSLQLLEGTLTGESAPVSKNAETIEGEASLAERTDMVYSGTIVTKGRGRAVITGTGMKTEIGRIANLIQETKIEQTPLQRDLDVLGGKLGKLILGICAAIFVIIVVSDGAFTLRALQPPFMLAVSLAVAAIPEGLPIVVTIALAFGTKRMVRKNALIKRLASVETLGSTDVICTDKTGTLTKNEMTVTRIWHGGNTIPVTGTGYGPDGEIKGFLPRVAFEISALCNDAKLTHSDEGYGVIGDPTEGCLLTLCRKASLGEEELRERHRRAGEVPFSSERKRMSTVNDFDGNRLLLTKGAPDVVLEHCTRILDGENERAITDADKAAIVSANEAFAKDALRVLALAFRSVPIKPDYDEKDENGLCFVCLTGMIDPPRPEAISAVQKCKDAGIRVVMITGDHQGTAVAIAKELGIEGRAVNGQELDDIDLDKEVEGIGVYARVNPEHKMRIVDALKKRGHIVAMTGDGVNDAPALKRADIGVAMGITGTDVAKESASMILTDDNFTSVVAAVEEGRNIYANIKKFVNYLLSSNFGEVLAIFLAIMLFRHDGEVVWPLTATMILLMNLVTDSLPALALGVDPGDPKAMTRPPRDPKIRIINLNMGTNIALIGVLVAGATLFMFNWSLQRTGSLAHAQTMALTTIVLLEIVRIAMIRAQYKTPAFSNKYLLYAIGIVLAIQALTVYTPFMNFVFGTVPLSLADLGLVALTCAATYVVGMVIGLVVRRVTGQRD